MQIKKRSESNLCSCEARGPEKYLRPYNRTTCCQYSDLDICLDTSCSLFFFICFDLEECHSHISISTSSLKHVANNSSIQQPMFGLSCIYCCLVVDFLLYSVLFVPHRWRPMFWLSVLWDLSHANMETWVVQPRYNVDHTDTFCHVLYRTVFKLTQCSGGLPKPKDCLV